MEWWGNSYRFESAWTPADITTALWLDAADASTITTVSGGVSQWSDKSGNGRHATQGTASNRPLLTANSQNGYSGITFDGVNDFLAFPSALLGVTHSLFMLFKPAIKSATGSVFGQWSSGATGRYLWSANQDSVGYTAAGKLNVFNGTTTEGSGFGNNGFAIEVSITNTATLIESISTTGGEQWKLLQNGQQWESATVTSVFSGVNSALGSVNATGSISPYDGVIYEVIHLASYADTNTRQRIEGYLAHKWGLAANLPSGHPYKSAPPTV